MTTEAFRATFTGTSFVNGDEGFSNYPFAAGAPSIVVRPSTSNEVATALQHAADNKLAVTVRSGGHSGDSYTTVAGGLVVDMAAFDEIRVNDREVTVGAGATWRPSPPNWRSTSSPSPQATPSRSASAG